MQMLPTWILLWITYYFDFITSVKPYEAVSRIQFPRSPYNDDEERGPLFPVIFNLAAHARISTNATCGLDRPEVYCKLVEHVLMKPPQCGICDANSSDPSQRHVIANAIDGSPRWWQSPTVANGNKFEYVTITIDMRQHYQVAYVIVKAANSPRPAAWELSRSLDNVTYRAWQYFARNDEECMDLFGISGSHGRPKFESDDQVICSTDFSKIHPLEDGEIHASLINDRPGTDGPSQALVEFTTARYIRLRFIKLHTLTADLMKMNDLLSIRLHDSSETRRYFYSIKDISIGGQCICFGHARDCPTDAEGIARCQCAHNTCGASCERCCPLFNQKLWKAGTVADPAVCEGCQCHGHADECHFDPDVANNRLSLSASGKYEGGGVCLNCKHNTTGINCERCRSVFFRPLGVDKFNTIGCLLCECEGIGSTGQCIADEESMFGELQPGDCVCLEGFGGPKCDHCAPGYKNYPKCEPCPCNYAGSKNGEACEGDCRCKDNVEGAKCDQCKEGYFNLDAHNPQGCTPCFCFGVTDVCESVGWNISKIATLDDWILTDSTGSRILSPNYLNGTPIVAADDTYEFDVFYWLAPKEYRGNRLTSYGGKLDYAITFIKGRGDLSGSYTADVDVILEGGGIRIGKGERFFRESTPHHLSVPLQEHGWYHVSLNGIFGETVTKENFMTILANVEKLMIRGTYHTRQLESRLMMVAMSHADERGKDGVRVNAVERCSCPDGYSGLSCETCSVGHRRVNEKLFNGICIACQCYAHAMSCDAYTGECRDCQHNTTGFLCDRCAGGYYGDAQGGDPDACKPCGCPLMIATNNFSPRCTAGKTPGLPDDYVCIDCPVGYFGAKCEMCSDGYFGDPLVPGNFCQPCACNGNIDLAALENCERISGKCLQCIGNTEGFSCERCKKGFHGNALRHDCQSCECNSFGSEHSDCNRNTGQCSCKPGYEGKKCDRCANGFGQISEGCLPCDCDPTGSLASECDPVSGQCDCLPGVFGVHCRRCQEAFYGFSATGCDPCDCETIGSINQTCEPNLGQCYCKPNVVGRSCNRCDDLYWGITSGDGCKPCDCDTIGAMSASCDPLSGQCKCRAGVTGRTCSECHMGYYGITSRGCTKCPVCHIPGQVCDRVTGECICPPNTVGERCEKCARNSYGYDPFLGCKLCNCSGVGATGAECDVVTGKCICKESFEGNQCDKCRFQSFGFPECKPCLCDLSGTDMESCREGKCGCDEMSGQCPCRANVVGRQCNQCKPNSFSLDIDNPKGCTDCFCSGKTNRCHQAPYIWKIIGHPGNSVRLQYSTSQTSTHHLNRSLAMDIINFDAISITYPQQKYQTPCYWNLPAPFLGDKALSYNGKLRFKLEADYPTDHHRAHGTLSGFPLALLQGNSRIILDYKTHRENGKRLYEIHFHESKWQNRQSPQSPVSRDLLMVALQNIQHFIIRGNTMPFPERLEIKNLELEIAGPEGKNAVNGKKLALGVEWCQCPIGYNRSSCQMPAEGFFRRHVMDFLDHPDHLKLMGEAVPCECTNHSKECDSETGRCFNCQQNTTGYHCERCSKGFYGDAKNVQHDACKRCACPTVEHSFSETCTQFRNNDRDDYICDSCRQGFTGDKCETCERGYYGNPADGIACKPCHCNPWGSLSKHCDPVTGQCECRGGLLGRDCSKCQVGHVITSAGCVNCMHDHCIKTLMDEFSDIDSGFDTVNTSGLNRAPLKRMDRLQDRFDQLSMVVQSAIGESASFMDNIFPSLESQFDFDREIRRVMLTANKSATDAIALREMGQVGNKNVSMACTDISPLEQKIRLITKNLQDYVLSEDSQGSLNVGLILTETEGIYADIVNRTLAFNNSLASGNLSSAMAVLAKIETLDGSAELVTLARNRYREIRNKIEEMDRYITGDIEQAVRQGHRIAATTARRIGEMQQNSRTLKGNADSLISTIEKTTGIRQKASRDYQNASRAFENAQMTIKDFRIAVDQLKNASGILENLNPEYQETLVDPGQERSRELTEKADMLTELFNEAKSEAEDPLKAARVFTNIVDQIGAAKNGTTAAEYATDEVTEVVFPPAQRALGTDAKTAVNASLDLEERARELLEDDVVNLAERFEEEKGRLDGVNATVRRTGMESDGIADRLYRLPEFSERIVNLSENSETLSETATNLLENTDGILASVTNHLRPRYDQKGIDPVSLNQTAKLVRELQSSMSTLTRNTTALQGVAKTLESLHKEMAMKIQRLRNVILAAKQAASSLQLSLSPDENGICRRSYEPPIIPGSANTITLSYATTSPDKSALLMYVGNPRSLALEPDFMAVEIYERRVRFIWNVGNDTKVIQHPDSLDAKESAYIQPNIWYKIEISRVKNTAQLSVLPMTEAQKSDPTLINGSSAAGFTRMDLNRSSEMFVGGLPHNVDVPEILSRDFFGCLGSIAIDGQQIGLWNYKTSVGCSGCAASSLEGGGDVGSFRFNGNGYASVPQIKRYNNKRYNIALTFRTYDENALLFLCANDKDPMGDFISLELRNGRVVFQFYLGGQNHLLVGTNRRFNTGAFVNVRAERMNFNADLQVEEDHIKASSPHSKPDGLELANRPIFFGGVPPGFAFHSKYNISYKPFIGCLKDIQIDVTSVDLRSENVYHVDVEQGCKKRAIRDVSFSNSAGFLKLPGKLLPSNASISFSFATGQADGLLIASISNDYKNDMNYWTASLQSGKLVMKFSSGGFVVKIMVENNYYDDRVLHTVSIRKRRKKIDISMDDKVIREEKLSTQMGPIASDVIYVGGVPSDVDLSGIAASARSFVGCITGLIINGGLIGFEQLQSFDRATIGRCEFDTIPSTIEPPLLAELLPSAMALSRHPRNCAPSAKLIKTPSDWQAVSFGSVENSHVEMFLPLKSIKLFNVTTSMRTFHASGVLLYAENPTGNEFIMLSLRAGQLVLTVNDEYSQEVSSEERLSDGEWHEIWLERKARRIILVVDGTSLEFIKLSKRFVVSVPFYVGGVREGVRLPSASGADGFRGCLANFTWNEKRINFYEEKAVRGLEECYLNVESAAFFQGSGYATYTTHFRPDGKVQIEMEFRTNSISGELVLLYDPVKRLYLQLKYVDSQVIFNISSHANSLFAIKQFSLKHRLCDGEWHRVRALFVQNVMTIDVDDSPPHEYAHAKTESLLDLPNDVPLYVGGRPASVPASIIPKVPNFVGCVRELSLNGVSVDFSGMVALHNVLLDSCPVAA